VRAGRIGFDLAYAMAVAIEEIVAAGAVAAAEAVSRSEIYRNI
jgi:hypothetical protein